MAQSDIIQYLYLYLILYFGIGREDFFEVSDNLVVENQVTARLANARERVLDGRYFWGYRID
jgi:hypothetical protein